MPQIIRSIVFLLFVLALCWLFSQQTLEIPAIDFLQYWSAAKIFIARANPYDPAGLLAYQSPVWPDKSKLPILMWNPPIILALIWPLAFLPFDFARSLWLSMSLIASVGLAVKCVRHFQLNRLQRYGACAIGLTFYPMALALFYGQITPFLFAAWMALVLSLLSSSSEKVLSKKSTGLLIAVLLLKPHLFFLPLIALIVQAMRLRLSQALLGTAAVCFAAWLAVSLWTPNVYAQYHQAISAQPPIYWRTPTLGSWLQAFTGINSVWIRLLPSAVAGCSVFAYCLVRKKIDSYFVIALLPLSLISAPYGWVYDQLLLWPVIVLLISRSSSALNILLMLVANLTMCFSASHYSQDYMVWYPLVVGLLIYFSKPTKYELVKK